MIYPCPKGPQMNIDPETNKRPMFLVETRTAKSLSLKGRCEFGGNCNSETGF